MSAKYKQRIIPIIKQCLVTHGIVSTRSTGRHNYNCSINYSLCKWKLLLIRMPHKVLRVQYLSGVYINRSNIN